MEPHISFRKGDTIGKDVSVEVMREDGGNGEVFLIEIEFIMKLKDGFIIDVHVKCVISRDDGVCDGDMWG